VNNAKPSQSPTFVGNKMEDAMAFIPENDDALLTREQTAHALTYSGFPTSPATLATKACRGGGPPFRRFGRKPLYRWGDTIAWAESRLGPPVRSTSEADLRPLRNSTDFKRESHAGGATTRRHPTRGSARVRRSPTP
jgi:hypothetical protein